MNLIGVFGIMVATAILVAAMALSFAYVDDEPLVGGRKNAVKIAVAIGILGSMLFACGFVTAWAIPRP